MTIVLFCLNEQNERFLRNVFCFRTLKNALRPTKKKKTGRYSIFDTCKEHALDKKKCPASWFFVVKLLHLVHLL